MLSRISSIDVLRGLIMIIMALDHVRDYFHITAITDQPTNLATTTPALFFTRWITHFCAPLFLFLSGISAYISGQRRTPAQLSSFLIKRGAWLVIAEIVIMSFVMTFNPRYSFILLAVFWVIGWSMILLGLLVRTSYKTILVAGLLLFFFHNVTDYIQVPAESSFRPIWQIVFAGPPAFFQIDKHAVLIGYTLLPCAAIMFLGYAVGALYKAEFDPAKRKRVLLYLGITLSLLFVVLRMLNNYGDPQPWARQADPAFSALSFLNTTKYPISLQFACMTLGPGMVALAGLENVRGYLAEFAKVYGKVPFFYFVGHFLLAHLLCVIAFYATGHGNNEIADPNSLFLFRPANFGFSLGTTYLVWIAVVLLMYFPCKWYGNYKQQHRHWWLSYL